MKRLTLLVIAVISMGIHQPLRSQDLSGDDLAHTFSVVAMDPVTGEMAVGVQSHWFSVGTVVCWGRSGVGVVATQSFVNPAYGPDGLDLMAQGKPAAEVLRLLTAGDEGREFRQVAMLDASGSVSAFTGNKCIASAGHHTGDHYSVQANMMLNDNVVPAMAEAYEASEGLPLAERVLKTLEAAQEAGGDIRGKQSAALIVVGPEPVDKIWLDKTVDLRVDDSAEPLKELRRLLNVHYAYLHMNEGDLAVEKGEQERALEEYAAAEALAPGNLEMKFWKAVALANNGNLDDALPVFREIFRADENWKELTRRLRPSGLLEVTEQDFNKIMKQ